MLVSLLLAIVILGGLGLFMGAQVAHLAAELPHYQSNIAAKIQSVMGTADVLLAILEADAGEFSVPSKILSYLCAGRAILAAFPGRNLASRTLLSANAGLVVSPSAPEAFLEAARRLRSDDLLRSSLARNAAAYASNEFDVEEITDRFEQLMELRASRA